jgi:polysaccharide biosynthesis protein PelC
MHTQMSAQLKKIPKGNLLAWCCAATLSLLTLQGCASKSADLYRDQNMDFGAIRTVGVLPLANYSRDAQSSDRVRDVLATDLLASGGIYVIPSGELARGLVAAGVSNPVAPSVEEVVKLCRILKLDAVITGSIREYGALKSASAVADVVSLSLQMIEGQTGRIVWSASATQGGIGLKDRLLGGGGEPVNGITEKAVNEIINKLF